MLKKEHWHLIRAGTFIILAFYILPEILPKIALHFSPGGLRMPQSPFLNIGMLSVLLLIAVLVKNYDALAKLRGPKIWEIIVFGALAAMEFAWFTGLLFAIAETLFWHLLLAGLAYGSGLLFLIIAFMGLDFFKHSWKDLASAGSAIIFFTGVTLFVDATRFHVITAKLSGWILDGLFNARFGLAQGHPTLSMEGFSVIIGPPCSGIFSMVLFTALFSFVYWLDSDKINKKRAITMYIIGVLGAFVINLLRVIVLMIVGAKLNPELAVGLFHNNAGWILFAGYSIVYWWLAYPYIMKK